MATVIVHPDVLVSRFEDAQASRAGSWGRAGRARASVCGWRVGSWWLTENYGEYEKRYKAAHQSFRGAMSAVAKDPEFDGNVFNVLTEKCWDAELAELSQRKSKIDNQIRQRRNKGQQNQDELKALRSKLMDEAFADGERKAIDIGKSNAEFHYLGSSKIMLRIGAAFAKAFLQE